MLGRGGSAGTVMGRKQMRASEPIRQRARELRCDQTEAEAFLWRRLRRKSLCGLKFRRQHPIGRFIVDFYCAEAKLVVEVDGGVHADQTEYDALRTEMLTEQGYRVVRCCNEDVLTAIGKVLERIRLLADADEA